MKTKIHVFADKDYLTWVADIKARIRGTQIRAALAANAVLIRFFYDLGRMITEKQRQTRWGDKLVERLAKDLHSEFPEMAGFSRTNLLYCKQFYLFISEGLPARNVIVPQTGGQSSMSTQLIENQGNVIVQQTVGQLGKRRRNTFLEEVVFNIPWGHVVTILGKVKDKKTAAFYFTQTLQNSWSRDVLALQIKSGLHKRQGKAVTNFQKTLSQPLSDLAQQTVKDPYVFDFLTLAEPYHEKDIENQLVRHLARFMLELGKGFAFVGQQYHLEVEGSDYYIDLLFYHVVLKCYVVVELKNTKFIPEYAGKLNFYLSAVDTLLKRDDDKPTIGILLCREKKSIEAEFALRDINKPIGVSEMMLTTVLPKNLASSLPTVAELEAELGNCSHDRLRTS
jgi:predicted nuclease of restriction endonuclease-like (RecB) superfamily